MVGFLGVLAHQGGWDEMLLVALPIALFVGLLRIANSRAARLHDAEGDGLGPDIDPAEPDPPTTPDR